MVEHKNFLFDPLFVEKEIDNLVIPDIKEKMDILKKWHLKYDVIFEQTEKQLQPLFINDVFTKVLNYSTVNSGENLWYMHYEESTEIDSSSPDAILGFYSPEEKHTKAVLELKGPKVKLDVKQKRNNKNYGTPIEQAYSYAPKFDGCEWIIVSNIYEIRLYKNGISQHYSERFFLYNLANDEHEFKRFYLLLHKDNLLTSKEKSKVSELRNSTYKKKKEITNEFYAYYKTIRINLWNSLIKNNPNHDELLLLEKAQKILDRIIFIRFCEDQHLLPIDTLRSYVNDGKKAEKVTIWSYLQELFRYIDRGNINFGINQFNGGLFEFDGDLDSLYIPDDIFLNIESFFDYNFRTELSVDILGHIFEQSISDLEELKGQKQKTGKRKKEGVFYTPEYVTQYIVEHSIGKWLETKKEKYGINELKDWSKAKNKSWRTRYLKEHISKYQDYQKALQNIKVLDPACGSGAFLIKAFDYLYDENVRVQKHLDYLEMILKKTIDDEQTIEIPEQLIGIDKNILRNNLFGVDLNKESVEITKLSLWIKTANRTEPLSALDENILVGNSVIEDPEIANDAAFDWYKNFKHVFDSGGFDVIIGNPPYVPIENMNKKEKNYLQSKYSDILVKKWDLSVVFMRKCAELMNDEGILSLIVPITWQTGPNYFHFRKVMFTKHLVIERLINLPYNIFPDAYVDTCIFVANKKITNKRNLDYLGYKYKNNNRINSLAIADASMDEISVSKYLDHYSFKIFASKNAYKLHDKISNYLNNKDTFQKLKCITISTQGPVESKFNFYNYPSQKSHFPYLKEGQGYRYFLNIKEKNYIELKDKPSFIQYYTGKPRIFFRRIVNRQDRIIACYCEEDLVAKKDLNPFVINDKNYLTKYVLALVNSKLLSYIYINFSSVALKDDFRQTTLKDLRDLPIRKINLNEQQKIVDKVEELETNIEKFHRKKGFVSALFQTELGTDTLSYKLQNFFELTLSEFIKEVKNHYKNINLKTIEKLTKIYYEYQPTLINQQQSILTLDSYIDQIVYRLYLLNDNEISQIEEYYNQFHDPSSIFPRDIDI